MMKERWKKGIAGEQRGAFIVFTALAIWFLMMFVAFAVDFGNYYQHRARLQNAADAAALAGVAKYADDDLIFKETSMGKGRLVKIPTDVTVGPDGNAASFSTGSYTFTRLDGVPSKVHDQGKDYVKKNYRSDMEIKEDSMWSAVQETTSSTTTQTTAGGTTQISTTTTTPKRYCYRVDLEDTVTTFFARIFGVETINVNVSAMAMLDGTESATVEELMLNISQHIKDFVPNYYWETIHDYAGIITDAKTGKQEATLAHPDDSDKPINDRRKLGERKVRYFVVTGGGASAKANQERLFQDDKGIIIGYQEPPPNANNKDICADPIYYEDNLADWDKYKNYATTRVFTIEEKEEVTKYQGNNILALFLNRGHINQWNDSIWGKEGAREKFTEINIKKITGTNNPKDPYGIDVPLYARLESEPVRMSTANNPAALMMAHGVMVNVELTTTEFWAGGVKPFVLAYDGPDPSRRQYDAPWLAKKNVDIYNGHHYDPAQIRVGDEPLLKKYQEKGLTVPNEMAQSAITTSGPIFVNIEPGRVFYGAIVAPRSTVYISGGGTIQGFILARDIKRIQVTKDGNSYTINYHEIGGNGEYRIISQEMEMPVLIAEHIEGEDFKHFNYTREYFAGTYKLATSLEDKDLLGWIKRCFSYPG